MPHAAILAAWLAGALGGLHCLAMCGAYVTLAQSGASAPLEPRRALRIGLAIAHTARIGTYVTLGALAGAVGGTAFAASFAPWQRALYVAANLLLLLLAVGIARGRTAPAALEALGLRLYSAVAPAAARGLRGTGWRARFALGVLWGLTPCALVYGVLPVALLSGGAWQGALIMLAFGLGTLPNLLAAAWVLSRARRLFEARWLRFLAGALVAAFALAGLWRAWFVPSSLGSGPFCFT
ncbi:MAG: sulfite exporter TauE/SafE family protein [Burkholderiales bacterium]|jgi:sulfite exporter TauE/SafE|nr:sulfite exporter TauE/SafE family protein [Burkholderiales bacterium]